MKKRCSNCKYAEHAFDEDDVFVCGCSNSNIFEYTVCDDDCCGCFEFVDDEDNKNAYGLLPCPFCGGKGHIMDMGYPHWVYCEDCGAKVHGGVVGEEGGEKASIAAWNRRVDNEG